MRDRCHTCVHALLSVARQLQLRRTQQGAFKHPQACAIAEASTPTPTPTATCSLYHLLHTQATPAATDCAHTITTATAPCTAAGAAMQTQHLAKQSHSMCVHTCDIPNPQAAPGSASAHRSRTEYRHTAPIGTARKPAEPRPLAWDSVWLLCVGVSQARSRGVNSIVSCCVPVRSSRSAPHNRGLCACGLWQRKGRHHQLLLAGHCQGFSHRELLCDSTHCGCTQAQAACMHLQAWRQFANSNALVLASA